MEMEDLLTAVRRQISDSPKSFAESFHSTGHTHRYQTEVAPLDAPSIRVYIDGTDVTQDCTIEASTGTISFPYVPPENVNIVVMGMHFRFFTTDELEKICKDAFAVHTARRTDVMNRIITMDNLSSLEELPLQFLCSIQAMYVLLTDASYDIDISAPDGVGIPRTQRYRQLYEMLQVLEARYRELSETLNLGMYATETFTFRRISKRTNRYVPIWRPQEIDDRSMPQRVYLPIPTYAGEVVDDKVSDHDITLYRGDTFKELITVKDYIPENARLRAQVKRYRGSNIAVAEFGVTRVDGYTVLLYMPHNRSEQFPERMVYDLQMETAGHGGFNADFSDDFEKREIKTLVGGTLICPKDVTTPRMTDYSEIPEVTPIQTGPHYSPSTGPSAPPSTYMYGTQ